MRTPPSRLILASACLLILLLSMVKCLIKQEEGAFDDTNSRREARKPNIIDDTHDLTNPAIVRHQVTQQPALEPSLKAAKAVWRSDGTSARNLPYRFSPPHVGDVAATVYADGRAIWKAQTTDDGYLSQGVPPTHDVGIVFRTSKHTQAFLRVGEHENLIEVPDLLECTINLTPSDPSLSARLAIRSINWPSIREKNQLRAGALPRSLDCVELWFETPPITVGAFDIDMVSDIKAQVVLHPSDYEISCLSCSPGWWVPDGEAHVTSASTGIVLAAEQVPMAYLVLDDRPKEVRLVVEQHSKDGSASGRGETGLPFSVNEDGRVDVWLTPWRVSASTFSLKVVTVWGDVVESGKYQTVADLARGHVLRTPP